MSAGVQSGAVTAAAQARGPGAEATGGEGAEVVVTAADPGGATRGIADATASTTAAASPIAGSTNRRPGQVAGDAGARRRAAARTSATAR